MYCQCASICCLSTVLWGYKWTHIDYRTFLNCGVFLEGVQQYYYQNIITVKWRNCEKSSDFFNHTFYNSVRILLLLK